MVFKPDHLPRVKYDPLNLPQDPDQLEKELQRLEKVWGEEHRNKLGIEAASIEEKIRNSLSSAREKYQQDLLIAGEKFGRDREEVEAEIMARYSSMD